MVPVEVIIQALPLEADTHTPTNLPIVQPLITDTPTAPIRIHPLEQTHIFLGPP